MQNIFG